jgi:hypothetical protein
LPGRGYYFDFYDQLDNSLEIHKSIVQEIEGLTKRTLVAYVANLGFPGDALVQNDIDAIEGILRSMNLQADKDDLDLLIESPGGTPDAAERLVRICRTYSKSFRAVVVGQAMSAATLASLGSDELVMGATSGLGPIDPQMVYRTKDGVFQRPAKSIIDAYTSAVAAAQQAVAQGQPADPFLHILDKLDVSFVIECLRAREWTKKVGMELLAKGLMKGKTPAEIETVVDRLIMMGDTTYHARPFWHETGTELGLNVKYLPPQDPLWEKLWELLLRMKNYTARKQLSKYTACRNGGIELRVQVVQLGG